VNVIVTEKESEIEIGTEIEIKDIIEGMIEDPIVKNGILGK
jgi:hypothetical protein